MASYKEYMLFAKLNRIIDSCQTVDQIDACSAWIDRISNQIDPSHYWDVRSRINVQQGYLFDKCLKERK